MNDAGGWLWLIIDVLFVVVLAGGLIYATLMWHTQRKIRAARMARELATRELYERQAERENGRV